MHHRTSRRLLAVAVMTGLAATGAPAVVPATAAPSAPYAAAGAEVASGVPKFAPGSEILAGGPSGFLTIDARDEMSWTRYADGARTALGKDSYGRDAVHRHGGLTDTVATLDTDSQGITRLVTLRDMATGAVKRVDLAAPGYSYVGVSGSTVIARSYLPGDARLHLLDGSGSEATDRIVAGLPAFFFNESLEALTDGAFLLGYDTGTGDARVRHASVIDTATATVTDTYRVWETWGSARMSADRIVWSGRTTGNQVALRLAERGSAEVTKTVVGTADNLPPMVGLLDGWLISGMRRGFDEGDADEDLALRARPLGGGTAKRLLDHASSIVPGPDGTALAMGGTVAHGEGLYRIAKGADGKPAATLVAGTGQASQVTLLKSGIPSVVRPSGPGPWALRWQLSRRSVGISVKVRHTATGFLDSAGGFPESEVDENGWFQWDFDGTVHSPGRGSYRQAPNGAYTWELTAWPKNGIGPTLRASGGFTVRRAAAPHDFTDDGTPDLFGRTPSGELVRTGSMFTHYLPEDATRNRLGDYWAKYTVLTVGGDVVGGRSADVLARDGAGVLWVYPGKGDGTLAARTRIGGGWNAYDQITAGSDHTGDGRADLVARDRSGVLWLYKGTGDADTPYKSRVRVSGGWGTYNLVRAVGSLGGSPAGDLVARDKDGVLWLHLGRGDGTFGSRIKVGPGWNSYQDIVGWGDADLDGKADLYARAKDGRSWFYHGTGDQQRPFPGRDHLDRFYADGTYNTVF